MSFHTINTRRKIVKIAQDVIQQINKNELTANNNSFFNNKDDFYHTTIRDYSAKEIFNKHFKNKKPVPCEVCAKGALTIAWIRKFNNCTMDELYCVESSNNNMRPDLVKTFGRELLDCIEVAFEKRIYFWNTYKVEIVKNYWKSISPKYTRSNKVNPNILLISIMQNIIDNKGQFVFNGFTAGI